MVTDQEPRYRLVDADGNVVGSLFAESDGTLKLQEGTSGNDNELSLTTQGALEVEQATTTSSLTAKGTTPLSLSTDVGEGFGGDFEAVTVQLDDSDSTTYVGTGLNANRSASLVFANMDPDQAGGSTVIWAIVTPFDGDGSTEGSLGSSVVKLAASGSSLDARLNSSAIEIRESSTGNEGNVVNIIRFRWF